LFSEDLSDMGKTVPGDPNVIRLTSGRNGKDGPGHTWPDPSWSRGNGA
jgi:hypothetical protein